MLIKNSVNIQFEHKINWIRWVYEVFLILIICRYLVCGTSTLLFRDEIYIPSENI